MPKLYAIPLLLLLLAGRRGTAQPMQTQPASVTAEEIMARVAAHQDRSETERAHFVYVQHAQVQSRKGKTLMCEEITDTRVTPTDKGNERTVLSLNGHVRASNRMIHYIAPPRAWGTQAASPRGDSQVDGEGDTHGDQEAVADADAGNALIKVDDTDLSLVESMRRQFTSDKSSRDGISNGLFPLTSQQQKGMAFTLKGREAKNGRDTFHITFAPRDQDDFGWKGDAWIDTASFQPVVVRTALSRSLPLGVRMLLGINLPGLGFTAVYAPQENDIWFPASFGTEFKVKVLFFFHREVIVNVVNRDFERTHVSSTLHTESASTVEKAPE